MTWKLKMYGSNVDEEALLEKLREVAASMTDDASFRGVFHGESGMEQFGASKPSDEEDT